MHISIKASFVGGIKANPAYISSVVNTAITMARMNNVFFFMCVLFKIIPSSKPNRQNLEGNEFSCQYH
jgi:hypothetical protein